MSENVGLGSIGVAAYFSLPELPDVVAEWAGLMPLAVHLGSSQDDYELVGEICLRGAFTVPLFPKLGQVQRITEFLTAGFTLLDQTSSKGMGAATVWDVSWGSVFQCANASAREVLTNDALRNGPEFINAEPHLSSTSAEVQLNGTGLSDRKKVHQASNTNNTVRRYQNLTVVNFKKQNDVNGVDVFRITRYLSSPFVMAIILIFILGLEAVLCLSSAFGTAAIILLGCTTKGMCMLIPTRRPSGYLQNTETYPNGCMLAAAHENSSSWFLYIGDRGIVDWLLNKPLIDIDQYVPSFVSKYFSAAHYAQLLIMTYVAAQKGWDGVCLLGLMIFTSSLNWALASNSPGREWLSKEGITCTATVARVSGRTAMLGACQLLNDRNLNPHMTHRNTTWMDSIITPSKRREVWTDALFKVARGAELQDAIDDQADLSEDEMKWVKLNTRLAVEAADLIVNATDRTISDDVTEQQV